MAAEGEVKGWLCPWCGAYTVLPYCPHCGYLSPTKGD